MMVDNQKYSIILPARIVEYFAETQTATVQISAEQISNNAGTNQGTVIRKPIEDVPVHTPSGGGWAMTMPIKAGNTCIMFFSQIGYDHWLYEDKDTAGKIAGLPKPWLKRQFHEDDGYALVGLNTLPRAIKDYSATDSQWRNEDATQIISLNEDLSIRIDSPVSVTINAPVVVANCDSATVNASDSVTVETDVATVNANSSATISTAAATIDASTSMDITTPKFKVDSPLATFTGLVACTGIGAGAAPAAGKMSVNGSIDATEDIVGKGVSVFEHKHKDTDGFPTTKPI